MALILLFGTPKIHAADNFLFDKSLEEVVLSPYQVKIGFENGYRYRFKSFKASDRPEVPKDKEDLIAKITDLFDTKMPKSENFYLETNIKSKSGKSSVCVTRGLNPSMIYFEFNREKPFYAATLHRIGNLFTEEAASIDMAEKFALENGLFFCMGPTRTAWIGAVFRAKQQRAAGLRAAGPELQIPAVLRRSKRPKA